MEKIIELIKNAKSAVILPHISADGDALGSCGAMRAALAQLGKASQIIAEEAVEPRLGFIGDGVTVYGGEAIDADLCIVLDCGDMLRLGERAKIAERANAVINIDHHRTNTRFGDASYVLPDAAATGEVLYDVFCALGITMTREIAGYLYTAICSDTGGFAFSSVSSHTFEIAAELVKHDIAHHEISRLLFDCVDIDSELLKAELTKNIHSYCDGKIRTVVISKAFAEGFNVSTREIDGLVDLPRRIRGTHIAVAIKELDDKIRVSLRSNGDADVSKVALKFGGGGHIKAAGCSVEDADLQTAEKLIVDACREVV